MCKGFASDGDDSTTFEFYCTGECAEADVTFWYRYAATLVYIYKKGISNILV